MAKASALWSNRQQRQLAYVSEYATDIRHIQGKQNPVADTLSRSTLVDVHLGIDYGAMAKAQQQDTEVQAYCPTTSKLRVEDIPFGKDEITLLCHTSTGRAWPIVPVSWRCQVFDSIQGLAHPSIRTIQKLMANKFIWNGLQKQIGIWAKQCIACQSSKIQTHIKTPPEKFIVPS